MLQEQFAEIISIIKHLRSIAIKHINIELINHYWLIGEYIFKQVENVEWEQAIVEQLAEFIQQTEPDLKGYSNKNLWRMKQFYEAYKDVPKLSTLLREISWSHNLAIFSRCKTVEEREFYLKLSTQENFSFRELNRQISSSLFERTMIGNTKLSTPLREIHPDITNQLKDSYVFEFLNLPEPYSESDLQENLIKRM